jgi:hypothetical protein
MKEIPLTQGKVALIDDEDYERAMKHKWSAHKSSKGPAFYVHCRLNAWNIELHRFILGLKRGDGIMIDHRNGNGLDNQKSNLRICTSSSNQWNHRKYINNTSGYIGVDYHKSSKRWRVQSSKNSNRIYLGSFNNKRQAVIARDKAVLHLHGEFASLNLPELFFNCAL